MAAPPASARRLREPREVPKVEILVDEEDLDFEDVFVAIPPPPRLPASALPTEPPTSRRGGPSPLQAARAAAWGAAPAPGPVAKSPPTSETVATAAFLSFTMGGLFALLVAVGLKTVAHSLLAVLSPFVERALVLLAF